MLDADLNVVPQLIPEYIRERLSFTEVNNELRLDEAFWGSAEKFSALRSDLFRYLLGYGKVKRPEEVKDFVLDIIGDVPPEDWTELLVTEGLSFNKFMTKLFGSFIDDELEALWEAWNAKQENPENDY
jgi:hypothetical protein